MTPELFLLFWMAETIPKSPSDILSIILGLYSGDSCVWAIFLHVTSVTYSKSCSRYLRRLTSRSLTSSHREPKTSLWLSVQTRTKYKHAPFFLHVVAFQAGRHHRSNVQASCFISVYPIPFSQSSPDARLQPKPLCIQAPTQKVELHGRALFSVNHA